MDASKQIKNIHIINKFGPHDNAITGQSAGKLADVLTAAGHKVVFFCIQESYKTLGKATTSTKNICEVITLQQRNFGKKGIRRLFSALSDGLRLTRQSVRQPADFVIVMTDPPLLYLWSGLHRRKRGRKLIYWTMDLYPEAFVSSGLVTVKSLLYLSLYRKVYHHTPFGIIALGEQQLLYIQTKFNRPFVSTILPCGIENIIQKKEVPEWMRQQDKTKIRFCYTGNIGEAHDEQFLIAFIKALQPERHVIYLNVYGAKAQQVLQQVQYHPAVHKIGYLSYAQMHHVHIHLATLKSCWDHICVPSKAVSAISAGAVLVLNSSTECDNWKMFGEACFNLQKTEDYGLQVKSFLRLLTLEDIAAKQQVAKKMANELIIIEKMAYNTILKWLHK